MAVRGPETVVPWMQFITDPLLPPGHRTAKRIESTVTRDRRRGIRKHGVLVSARIAKIPQCLPIPGKVLIEKTRTQAFPVGTAAFRWRAPL